MKHLRQNGFTLLEVLMAIALLMTVVVGTLGANTLATRGVTLTQTRSEATRLAKEGMEAVASVRAADFISLTSGTFHPVSTAGGWTLSPGSEIIGGFTRFVILTPVNRALACGTTICDPVAGGGVDDVGSFRVKSQVDWIEAGLGKSVVLETLITFWR